MTHPILVAYGGTEAADRAFEVAEIETHVMRDRQRVECAAYLRALPERGAAVRVEVEVEVAEGVPAWEIARAARRIGAQLIVIGHRQRSLLRRCMEASVAKRVLDRAPCAVLVAPATARKSP